MEMEVQRILFGVLLSTSVFMAQSAALEHLAPSGLPKPVLVVAGGVPRDFENKDKAPVIDALKDDAPAGFQFLKTPTDQPRPGLVGLYVPPDAIFQVRKRVMSNFGKGTVT